MVLDYSIAESQGRRIGGVLETARGGGGAGGGRSRLVK